MSAYGRMIRRGARVAVGIGMRQAAVAVDATLPVKLHFDAVVAVGVQGLAGLTALTGADDDGGLLAGCVGGLLPFQFAHTTKQQRQSAFAQQCVEFLTEHPTS